MSETSEQMCTYDREDAPLEAYWLRVWARLEPLLTVTQDSFGAEGREGGNRRANSPNGCLAFLSRMLPP